MEDREREEEGGTHNERKGYLGREMSCLLGESRSRAVTVVSVLCLYRNERREGQIYVSLETISLFLSAGEEENGKSQERKVWKKVRKR